MDPALWVGAVVCAGLTLYFSFATPPQSIPSFAGVDKLEHFSAYFTTTLLFFLAGWWRPGRGAGSFYRWRRWIVGAVIAAGGLIEIAQRAFTSNRKAEWLDWVSEIVAALLAALIVVGLARRTAGRDAAG